MRFKGFTSPRYTPCPDELFDELLPDLGHAELKALLYIIRRTFGFKKDSDSISFNQFLHGITTHDGTVLDRGCGIKKASNLSAALKSLEEKGIILCIKTDDPKGDKATTIYALHFVDGVLPQKEYGTPAKGGPVLPAQEYGTPGTGGQVLPQKEQQETGNKNRFSKRKKDEQPNRAAIYAKLAAEQTDRLAAFLQTGRSDDEQL
jgi:hypothetical protein